MRPTPVEVLRGIQATLASNVLPELSSRYAQAQVMYSIMLLDMLAKEIEHGARWLAGGNATMRRLFARGAALLEGAASADAALVADLRAAAVDAPAASSSMTALREESERLRSLLARLGAACDESIDTPALAVLWDEIIDHLREERAQWAHDAPR